MKYFRRKMCWGKGHLKDLNVEREDNIKIDLKEIELEDVN